MFGQTKREHGREEWRTKPIEREHAGHLLTAPDTAVLAEEVVDRADILDANSSETEKALILGKVQGTIWNIVVERGSERLQQVDEAAAAGMEILIERDDFRSEMLFDYLSMHDAPGIVIHNKIVEHLTSEQFTTDLAEVLHEQRAAGKLTLIGYLEQIALDIAGQDNEAAAAKLLENWRRSLIAHAHENLGNAGLFEHYAELDAIVKRPDCSTEMVYNFLLNLGAGGRAIAEDWRSKLFATFDPDAREEMPADDGHNAPPEDQVRHVGESNDTPLAEPPSQPEPARRQVSMSYLHGTITEALDQTALQYTQPQGRNESYFLEREGIMLGVTAKGAEEKPTGVVISALVLENVECTTELTADLLKRNGKIAFSAWALNDQPDGTVRVTLSYDLRPEQLDVLLVGSMVTWVLDKATAEVDALQETYGGKRPVAVIGEPPELTPMPTGYFTVAGRYPGYEPAQAIAAFRLIPRQHGRPSYEEICDSFWIFQCGGYGAAIGCFAEPEGTSVIVLAGFSKPDRSDRAAALMMDESSALEKSADSTHLVLPDEVITESGKHVTLRQLRPSEVGPIPDSASEKPVEETVPSLRFDGLYHAQGPSYQSYLRFYEDGTVLQVSTNGKPEQLARWFAKTHTEVPKGTYAIDEQSMEFSTVSSEGTVAYKGSVFDETVELSSHSYIDGHEDQATYSFVQVALQ